MKAKDRRNARIRRHRRVRKKVLGTSVRPRLAVFRSARHIYAQLIDDVDASTLVAASSKDADASGGKSDGGKVEAAGKVGELLAKRARDAGISEAIFDRGGYKYHGRVAALAEAARKGGLEF